MDLNADLGEGGPSDAELLDVVTSASVACGLHAGDPLTMLETARMAAARGVAVGAHPSYPDRDGFGRRPMKMSDDELFASVVYQVGAMAAAASAAGTSLAYVKAHGALYNQAASERAVAETLVRAVAAAGLPLLCPPGSQTQAAAEAAGVTCFAEAFADRGYRPDGSLVPRGRPGSIVGDPDEVARRAVRMAREGVIHVVDGSVREIGADSICIHGDTPGALGLARSVRRALEEAGVVLQSFVPS